MLKDDRMMGMLTFVVILVAMGTLLQRVDFVQRLFGTAGPPVVLKPDRAQARATVPASIDVLANDSGVQSPQDLIITASPRCGRAFVADKHVKYMGTLGCVGEQTLRYGLRGTDQTAEVRIDVIAPGKPAKPSAPRTRPGAAATSAARQGEVASGAPVVPGVGTAGGTPGAGTPAAPLEGPGEQMASANSPQAAGALAPNRPASSVEARDRAGMTAPTTPPPQAGSPGDANGNKTRASGGSAVPGAGSGATAGKPPVMPTCKTPPTVTLDVRHGAQTEVAIDSPCQPGTVAELSYDGLRFAIALDARGSGSLAVPGFTASSRATLKLARRQPESFDLSFEDIGRIDRVAVAWKARTGLALNAFEFGARPDSQGHVSPSDPRSFEAVRRSGGGWLTTYKPDGDKGQLIEVYSFWRRHDGPSGVVRLALDPGHTDGAGTGSCKAGGERGADYVVLRSMAGKLVRSRLGRIAPLDCTALASAPDHYIENAVDDLIVRHR